MSIFNNINFFIKIYQFDNINYIIIVIMNHVDIRIRSIFFNGKLLYEKGMITI